MIEDARFKTYGCGSAIASSSLVTEWVKGKTLEQAETIRNTQIAGELALPPVGLRLGVRTSGCSGLAYRIEYADAVNPDDQTFESHGVKVVVDPKSLQFLEGTELDFAREGLNEGFKFNNPNVKDECGCGESFNV